jgi:DNA-binding IclR family transcriptional regulator
MTTLNDEMTARSSVNGRRYPVPALEKGLDILELLADTPRGLTQTEIANRLDRSVSEIFRMIACLRHRGYLATVADGDRYMLTSKLFELSHRHPPMKRLLTEAMPLMNELARTLDQSCHLTVYHGGAQLVVAQVDSLGGMGFSVRMGARIDILQSASGYVLIACQAPLITERMLAEYRGAVARKDLGAMRKVLDGVRRRGYAEMDSVQVRGVRGISFPVRTFDGNAVAALAVPYLEQLDDPNRKSLDQAREALREAAGRLSLAIGGGDAGT